MLEWVCHLPSPPCDLPPKDRNGVGCGGGGHPALGVCATIPKCSAQGDLTYLFGPRQADIPEGSGEGVPHLPTAENPLSVEMGQ